LAQSLLTIGVATRPFIGETANGDVAQVDWSEDRCRIAVIDALGHGVEAARDAALAASALREHPDLSSSDALSLCDRQLRGRRGAAIGVAAIDVEKSRLYFAGIGNVEGRLYQDGRPERLISYRGIVGVAMRTIRTFEYSLESAWTLVLHTDGVSARFEDGAVLNDHVSVDEAAQAILHGWGRERDDATVVVVRSSAGDPSVGPTI
jgi:serine phosphatase RsbU (regulator of sigma subunit)